MPFCGTGKDEDIGIPAQQRTQIGDDIHVSACEHTGTLWILNDEQKFYFTSEKVPTHAQNYKRNDDQNEMRAKKEQEQQPEEEEEVEVEEILFSAVKLKRERRHLLAFNRKPQHKQSFRNVPHSLDQNFICSILCVDYNSVNDAGRFIYLEYPLSLHQPQPSPSVSMSVCVCVQCVLHEIFKSLQTTMHRMVGEAEVVKYLAVTARICMCAHASFTVHRDDVAALTGIKR